jgi:hypothetical protein
MNIEEWFDWKSDFKRIASEILGFNVIEMED